MSDGEDFNNLNTVPQPLTPLINMTIAPVIQPMFKSSWVCVNIQSDIFVYSSSKVEHINQQNFKVKK